MFCADSAVYYLYYAIAKSWFLASSAQMMRAFFAATAMMARW